MYTEKVSAKRKKLVYIYTGPFGIKYIYFFGLEMPIRHFIIGLIFLIIAVISIVIAIVYTPMIIDLVSIFTAIISIILTILSWSTGLDRSHFDTKFNVLVQELNNIRQTLIEIRDILREKLKS